jgi:hypothetical protein
VSAEAPKLRERLQPGAGLRNSTRAIEHTSTNAIHSMFQKGVPSMVYRTSLCCAVTLTLSTLHLACSSEAQGELDLDNVGTVSQALVSATETASAQNIPANSTGPVTAPGNGDCPNSIAVGGGFYGKESLFVYNTKRYQDGWRTYARNTSSGVQTLASAVVCLSGLNGTMSEATGTATVPAGGSACAVATCASGVATGGGFASSSQPSTKVYVSVPNSSNGWTVCARNSGTTNVSLKAYVECLANTGATTSPVSGSLESVPPGEDGIAAATCPGGTVSVGGGYRLSSSDWHVMQSRHLINGWQVDARNDASTEKLMYAVVQCLTPP